MEMTAFLHQTLQIMQIWLRGVPAFIILIIAEPLWISIPIILAYIVWTAYPKSSDYVIVERELEVSDQESDKDIIEEEIKTIESENTKVIALLEEMVKICPEMVKDELNHDAFYVNIRTHIDAKECLHRFHQMVTLKWEKERNDLSAQITSTTCHLNKLKEENEYLFSELRSTEKLLGYYHYLYRKSKKACHRLEDQNRKLYEQFQCEGLRPHYYCAEFDKLYKETDTKCNQSRYYKYLLEKLENEYNILIEKNNRLNKDLQIRTADVEIYVSCLRSV